MVAKILFLVLLLFLASCSNIYEYEVCQPYRPDERDVTCNRFQISRIPPSTETTNICNIEGKCEQVPINRLLFKGGTDKQYCNGKFNQNDFVDNWWNAEGLVDECEMPPNSNMQFIFKQHNQDIYKHTGEIQITIQAINYYNDYRALQVFAGEDNDDNNLPDEWRYCGNVDKINGQSVKVIHCSGNNLKFIKIVNAPWNIGNLYIDYVEVLKI